MPIEDRYCEEHRLHDCPHCKKINPVTIAAIVIGIVMIGVAIL